MKKNPKKDNQSFADKLEDRLIEFAVRIIRLAARLPRTPTGETRIWTDPSIRHIPSTKLWRGARRGKPRRFPLITEKCQMTYGK
jgi:hypothetical protein